MPRRIRLPAVLCALTICAGLAVTAAGAGARSFAHASAACNSASPGSLRGGYYINLVVKGTGCGTGRGVEAGWQGCRLKHGLGGRCHSKVLGFSCHELRQAIATQLTAKVSCRRGSRTVGYTYQQNLV